MGHHRLSLPFGSVVIVVLLVAVVWLAVGIEAFYRVAPPGSDDFRIQMVNTSGLRLSYRLPRGLPWHDLYGRLANQGWVIRDDELLVWPDLMEDHHTAAVFWRRGWLRIGRQWLTVRRDMNDSQRYVIGIIQCTASALSAPCV